MERKSANTAYGKSFVTRGMAEPSARKRPSEQDERRRQKHKRSKECRIAHGGKCRRSTQENLEGRAKARQRSHRKKVTFLRTAGLAYQAPVLKEHLSERPRRQ